jgi:serine phosphatase RsbU (regulator of sigma subunit)/anti-sigma regulatory factor (Ser/Thr protein kinase)
LAVFLQAPGAVELEKLNLDSPTLRTLEAAGVKVTIPLINQGELVGLLNLGARLSEQEYSSEDYRLLSNLASQAAPALRVAQLVRQQQAELQQRERLEQELRVARIIQETLLPKETPSREGWEMAGFWQPARAVGGDFYDFIPLPHGRLGLVIGDVTDKGVPAALLMATTRSTLRAAAERYSSPGLVLERVNELLCGDIPRNMFVTCQYIILDPNEGRLVFANAGHNLPILRSETGVQELRATGMPLGLLPNMSYEEKEAFIEPGESLLLYSDGLVEAHSPLGELFGFPALRELVAGHPGGGTLIPFLLEMLQSFTGEGWEQEDDVTLLTLKRVEVLMPLSPTLNPSNQAPDGAGWRSLATINLPSKPGNERRAMELVAEAVSGLNMNADQMEKLKTAVAEATMNAMEHGNKYQADLPVSIQVLSSAEAIKVCIIDEGGATPIPETKDPDLEAKLAGLQSPRGWGLFLIKNMVDEMHIYSDEAHHTMELILRLDKGGQDDR